MTGALIAASFLLSRVALAANKNNSQKVLPATFIQHSHLFLILFIGMTQLLSTIMLY
jgi:hypothetical protein